MALYVVVFRSDVVRRDRLKSDFQVTLFATEKDEATRKAKDFFEKHGGYVPRYDGATLHLIAGTKPRYISTHEVPAGSIFYEGGLFEGEPPYSQIGV